jgi:hypothetical protein
MNRLGFSTIYTHEHDKQFYRKLLKEMLAAGCSAIELQTPGQTPLDDSELVDLLKQFGYRSIHTSDIHNPTDDADALAYYRELAQRIDADALTIHPYTMGHWAWLTNYFGELASFENMDRFKPFGRTPEDLVQVRNEYPTARWTFDINHVFTNDPSLASVTEFYEQLGAPGHYHISGFKDASLPHTKLYTTHQDAIITAVRTDAPVIIESFGPTDIEQFKREYDYIAERLASHPTAK